MWAEETGTYSWSRFCTFPQKVRYFNRRPLTWEVSVLPLHHRGPSNIDMIQHGISDVSVYNISCSFSQASE